VPCPHARDCAGCPLILLPSGEQLERKASRLRDALNLYGTSISQHFDGRVTPAPSQWDYRRRAKLVVDGDRIGLFRRGTHEVVDIPDCQVLAPELRAALVSLRKSLPTLSVPLGGVDARLTRSGLLLTFIVISTAHPSAVPSAWHDELRAFSLLPGVVGLAISTRPAGSPRVLGGQPWLLAGHAAVPDSLTDEGPEYLAAHGAFVQSHEAQAARVHTLIQEIVDGVGPQAKVLELYAGSGALALRLARAGHAVTAVESFAPAMELLRRADHQHRIELVTADATEWLQARLAGAVRRESGALPQFGVIVVDPPRRGLSPEMRDALGRARPNLLVYLSCDPVTLARDLADLSRRGFAVTRISAFDFIPQSEHVETLVTLSFEAPPLPTVIHAGHALVAVDKSAHEPTTPQGECEGSLLERVRRLADCELAVPVHRLDADTSGVCLFARRPELVPPLAAALADGSKEYFALVRGVIRAKGRITRPLREAGRMLQADTRYRRVEVLGGHSLIAVWPSQGRKHQIRKHLAAIGHPVIGDGRHGDAATNRHFSEKLGLDRQFLHCGLIELAQLGLTLRAPLPPDLEAVLQRLRHRAEDSPSLD